MSEIDELSAAIDQFGKTALKIKHERDVLAEAFKKIRNIIMEAEEVLADE